MLNGLEEFAPQPAAPEKQPQPRPASELPFKVKRHPRARKVRIRVDMQGRIVVTAPPRVTKAEIARLVRKNLDWVAQQMEKVAERHRENQTPKGLLPDVIHLQAIGWTLQVAYRHIPDESGLRLSVEDETLILSGDTENHDLCAELLRRWLKMMAARVLKPLLDMNGFRLNLPPPRLSVRLQSTRWGSCSARGTISLNAKLLFLPRALVEHVIRHELAHTVHLDHSAQFYALLEKWDPDHRRLAQELKQAKSVVPLWADGAV